MRKNVLIKNIPKTLTSFIARDKMSSASIKVELWNIGTSLKNNDVVEIKFASYKIEINAVITNTDYIIITVIGENFALPNTSTANNTNVRSPPDLKLNQFSDISTFANSKDKSGNVKGNLLLININMYLVDT